MATAAKKAAPAKTAAKRITTKKATDDSELVVDNEPVAVSNDAHWLALQWLLPRAFPNAQWPHASSVIDDSDLPQEVKDILHEAYGRASA